VYLVYKFHTHDTKYQYLPYPRSSLLHPVLYVFLIRSDDANIAHQKKRGRGRKAVYFTKAVY
jgi:hypothetical protein